jgi:lysozyme
MEPDQKRRIQRTGAWVVVAVAFIASYEGLQTRAYRDVSPAHVLSICYGETQNVQPGERHTPAECMDMLEGRVWDYYDGIVACVPSIAAAPPKRIAAFVSFAYWRGIYGFCRSRVAKLYKAGNIVGACEMLLSYDSIAGVTFRGLTRRRREERSLCLMGQ